MITSMVKDLNNFKTNLLILVIMLMESQKAEVLMFGLTMKYIRDNGTRDKSMAVEFGRVRKEIVILVNGSMEKPMDSEYTSGLTEIVMKDNLRIV